MITPTMNGPLPYTSLRADAVKMQPKKAYERALAAQLRRIAGPPGALAATIAIGLANHRQRRISVILSSKKSVTI